jgi:hypothetical protein
MTDDTVNLTWEDNMGTIHEATFTLEEAAALQRGETVTGRGNVTDWTLADNIATLEARQAQIKAEMNELERQYPGIGTEDSTD